MEEAISDIEMLPTSNCSTVSVSSLCQMFYSLSGRGVRSRKDQSISSNPPKGRGYRNPFIYQLGLYNGHKYFSPPEQQQF